MRESNWDLVIRPEKSIWKTNLGSIWRYKDLLSLFIKRDFVSTYKQTVLGPVWFFIQPLLTTITFTVIFGNLAKIPTGGIPSLLFYMSGITLWNYFSESINKTSNTFVANQGLFGKVYFPRIIVPIAVIVNNLMKLGIQLVLLIAFWSYYYFFTNSEIRITWAIFLFPVLIFIMAILGAGIGMIVSSLTTKYRDFTFLLGFGVQLMMYASPVVYPLSIVPDNYKWLVLLNPMSSVIEFFKFSILGEGYLSVFWLGYSVVVSLIVSLFGLLIFNKVEKSFIDTV